jgi:predicted XRE-type DNA-binding protein
LEKIIENSESNIKEIWLPIHDYEEWYEVSSFGEVRRIKYHPATRVGKILKQYIDDGGYSQVHLSKHNRVKTVRVHRLVAVAFFGYPKEGQEVNHKNGIKTDNRIKNLEWCTTSENILHRYRVLGIKPARGEQIYNSKLNCENVLNIKNLLKTTNLSHTEIGKMFDVSYQTISDIKSGRCWSWLNEDENETFAS